ncbi:MAG: DUF1015 domain-containing protein, partial [Clostridia bacterium]|nr:DUF1015 domain-containing protein [Clostridia bacterium]
MSLNLSFQPADILLPKEKFEKWAVIACDQYTSDPAYWQKREDEVGDCPSALHIIFPEVYLSDKSSKAARIQAIHRTMRRYLSDGVLEEIPNTFVYTERRTQGGLRRGVIGLIDLEDYSFEKHTDAAIRATEETVEERIPPRVEIRRGAPIETPHVLLLIDDPHHTVIEPLAEKADRFQTLYDFDLCAGGGHIKGYAPDAATGKALCEALEQLKAKNNGFLFAVGDGNHSLACAKECYRLDPTPRSRYALVEIVNIHDPSLHFEPIYRVLFGVDPQEVIAAFTAFCGGETDKKRGQLFTCVSEGYERVLSVAPSAPLAVGTLQRF